MTQSKDHQPQPPEQRVGYAVLGLGELTYEELLPAYALSSRSRLAALVSNDREKATKTALAHGLTERDVFTYDEFEQLAQRPDVGAVYIVLPNNQHREYTERAAKMGKHVLCEKPLATTPEDAGAMVAACQAANVKLMTAYRCQYTPHHWAARDHIQNGQLGPIKLIEATDTQVEPNEGQWRLDGQQAGGGSLLDVGLYCLNTTRFLLAEEPYEVFAYTHSTEGDERFREVEESVAWLMRFPGGAVALCSCSYGAVHTRSLRVLGDAGRLTLDPAFDYHALRLSTASAQAITEHLLPELNQFTLELDHFSACVQEDRQPFTPGEEGLQDQRIMAAIYQSAKEGRPVQLERVGARDAFRGAPPQRPPMERS